MPSPVEVISATTPMTTASTITHVATATVQHFDDDDDDDYYYYY